MIGRTITHYRITEKLGAGGMGEVYLADDLALGRPVALKFLTPEHTRDAERLRRFQQEARAASALNHPHILTIHEMGEADGLHFIATEFIDGETLRTVLDRTGPMAEEQAIPLALQIAGALAAAHQAGIVHRDIKPENIMVRRDGYAKVLDFGIAKLTEPPAGAPDQPPVVRTESGVIVGTTGYLSPEQATGGRVDARSDIFAFGALLYEMVAGAPAFQRATPMETVAAILAQEPRPLPADVAPGISQLIARCLQKDPGRRFQSMVELKTALAGGLERPGRPAGAATRRRLAGAVLLVLAATAAFLLWRTGRPSGSSAPLEAVPFTTLPGVARYPSFSPEGDRVAFSWTGVRQDNPDVYVQQVGSGTPLRLTTDPGNDFNPAWSPDGRLIAFLRSHSEPGRSEVRLIPPLGGPERKLTDIRVSGGLTVTPPYLAWCPDSSCLVVTDSPGEGKPDALFVLSLDSGERRQVTHPESPAVGDAHPAVSPDGKWLVFRRQAGLFVGALYRLPLREGLNAGSDPVRITEPVLDAQHPAWLPGNREILFSARNALFRLAVASGGNPERLPFVGEYGIMPAVSAPRAGAPSRLVYVRSYMDGNIWKVETPAPGAPAPGPPVVAIASTRVESMPQYSPDGGQVAFASDRSGDWEIWRADPDGGNPVQLTALGAVAGYPHWSPDGKSIVFHGSSQGQWDVFVVPREGGTPRNLSAHQAADDFPSFSRDGRWIYFSSDRGGGQQQAVWKMPSTGGAAIRVTGTFGYAAQESPDRASLYYVEAIDRPSPLWRMPASGGEPARVLDGILLGNYAVVSSGVYHIDRPAGAGGIHYVDNPSGKTRLRYFDFASERTITIADNLGPVDLPLTVSPDGRTVLFPRLDASVNDLMMVSGFR